jgi:hypothetical protein
MFVTMGFGFLICTHFALYHNIILTGIAHGMVGTTLLFFRPQKLCTSFSTWWLFRKEQRQMMGNP